MAFNWLSKSLKSFFAGKRKLFGVDLDILCKEGELPPSIQNLLDVLESSVLEFKPMKDEKYILSLVKALDDGVELVAIDAGVAFELLKIYINSLPNPLIDYGYIVRCCKNGIPESSTAKLNFGRKLIANSSLPKQIIISKIFRSVAIAVQAGKIKANISVLAIEILPWLTKISETDINEIEVVKDAIVILISHAQALFDFLQSPSNKPTKKPVTDIGFNPKIWSSENTNELLTLLNSTTDDLDGHVIAKHFKIPYVDAMEICERIMMDPSQPKELISLVTLILRPWTQEETEALLTNLRSSGGHHQDLQRHIRTRSSEEILTKLEVLTKNKRSRRIFISVLPEHYAKCVSVDELQEQIHLYDQEQIKDAKMEQSLKNLDEQVGASRKWTTNAYIELSTPAKKNLKHVSNVGYPSTPYAPNSNTPINRFSIDTLHKNDNNNTLPSPIISDLLDELGDLSLEEFPDTPSPPSSSSALQDKISKHTSPSSRKSKRTPPSHKSKHTPPSSSKSKKPKPKMTSTEKKKRAKRRNEVNALTAEEILSQIQSQVGKSVKKTTKKELVKKLLELEFNIPGVQRR